MEIANTRIRNTEVVGIRLREGAGKSLGRGYLGGSDELVVDIGGTLEAAGAIAREATAQANRVLADNNPLATDLAREKAALAHLDHAFAKMEKRVKNTKEKVERTLKSKVVDPDADIQKSLADSPFVAETRAALRAMSLEERKEFMAEAIANSDWDAAVAVLGAPAYLSGLSKSDFEYSKERYMTARYSAENNYAKEVRIPLGILEESVKNFRLNYEDVLDRTKLAAVSTAA